MTAVFLVVGLAVLLGLLALDARAAGAHRQWLSGLSGRAPLVPGVAAASIAVLVASWLPAPADPQPRWISALVPGCAVVVFLLVAAQFRRHGHSTRRSRR